MPLWRLYLDDIRYPLGDGSWTLARNYEDACWYVKNYGLPRQMSLDHDLGENVPTGHDFIKWLAQYILDNNIIKPKKRYIPECYSHSDNPTGKINIICYWSNFVEKGWTTQGPGV